MVICSPEQYPKLLQAQQDEQGLEGVLAQVWWGWVCVQGRRPGWTGWGGWGMGRNAALIMRHRNWFRGVGLALHPGHHLEIGSTW